MGTSNTPGFFKSAIWVSIFSFKEMVRRRRLLVMSLVMLIPPLMVLLWRFFNPGFTAIALLDSLMSIIYVHFMVAIVSLAFGLSAIGEIVDDGTVVYYWTRPMRREAIYLGRLFSAQIVSSALLVISIILCFLIMTIGNSSVLSMEMVKLYVSACVVLLVGSMAYTAIFAAVGTVLKKPMLPALIFAFWWESISSHAPMKLQELTVACHLRNLLSEPSAESTKGGISFLEGLLRPADPPSNIESFLVILAVIASTTIIGAVLMNRKEIFK
jgi:ABC-type transport system involved in multi-copper enzyme maturation permease subunit